MFDLPISRRKLPTGNAVEDRFQDLLSVDVSYLTGARVQKKARRSNELELFYGALQTLLSPLRALSARRTQLPATDVSTTLCNAGVASSSRRCQGSRISIPIGGKM